VHDLHKCTYIHQYHTLRPYIPVRKVPDFDPTQLPYWSVYSQKTLEGSDAKNVSYNPDVKIGGTMAGKFVAGLSGGQRKMMAFELVRQRTSSQSDLLIVLDEPFAGVTDNFVPFISERLAEMARKHNLVLVTNDHVDVLTKMADSTITVSAIDRSKILVDGKAHEQELVIHALAKGEGYNHDIGNRDLSFFVNTELITSPQIHISLGFTFFLMALFLLTFWDSEGPESLVLVAIQILAFFSVQPFLIGLTDWRNIVREEAEALMHSSVQSMLALKTIVTLSLVTVVITVAWGCLVAVLDTSVTNDPEMWVAMLFDIASFTLPYVLLGLYSRLPLQFVQMLGGLPFLFMTFFSSTFSPSAGVDGLKAFRFLFPRFYMWCRLPDVKDMLEDCPAKNELTTYTVLSGCLGLFLFLVLQAVRCCMAQARADKAQHTHEEIAQRPEYQQIQVELYESAQRTSSPAICPEGSRATLTYPWGGGKPKRTGPNRAIDLILNCEAEVPLHEVNQPLDCGEA
jgi:hypothetical protein